MEELKQVALDRVTTAVCLFTLEGRKECLFLRARGSNTVELFGVLLNKESAMSDAKWIPIVSECECGRISAIQAVS